MYAIYALIASLGLFGVGKIGAATNYLIEPKAAWSLFLALFLGTLLRPAENRPRQIARTLLCLGATLFLTAHVATFLASSVLYQHLRARLIANSQMPNPAPDSRTEKLHRWLMQLPPVLLASSNRNPSAADLFNSQRLVATLRASSGPVLCEHAVPALRAGKDVYIQPFIMKELAKEGKWDQRSVVEALRRKEFSLIATTEDVTKDQFFFHYTDEMVAAMRAAYRLRETLGGRGISMPIFTYYVFEPAI